MIQDIYSRKLWAKATEEKGSDDYIEVLESLFADTGKPKEINADGKFDNRAFNRFLSRRGISVRYKQGRNDLATLDAAMHNCKKMLKKQLQDKNTNEWEPLVPKVAKAHNNLSHEALMAGADPNDAYDESNKALQFELREAAGRKIASKCSRGEESKECAGQWGISDLHWTRRHQKKGRPATIQRRGKIGERCGKQWRKG